MYSVHFSTTHKTIDRSIHQYDHAPNQFINICIKERQIHADWSTSNATNQSLLSKRVWPTHLQGTEVTDVGNHTISSLQDLRSKTFGTFSARHQHKS